MSDTNLVNQAELDECWNYFENTLSNIYDKLINNKNTTISPNIQILLYDKIVTYSSKSKKHKEALYDKLCNWTSNTISSLVRNEKNKLQLHCCKDNNFCNKVITYDKYFKKFIRVVEIAFSYLYKHLNQLNKKSVRHILYKQFIQSLYVDIEDVMIENIISCIYDHKKNKASENIYNVKESIALIRNIGAFSKNENLNVCANAYDIFLDAYAKYLVKCINTDFNPLLLETINQNNYINSCTQTIQCELDIIDIYDMNSDASKINDILSELLIINNMDIIINEIDTVHQDQNLCNNYDYYTHVFALGKRLKNVNEHDGNQLYQNMMSQIGNVFSSTAKKIYEEYADKFINMHKSKMAFSEKILIQSIIKLIDKYDELIEKYFSNELILLKTMKSCYNDIVNEQIKFQNNAEKPPLIVEFIDVLSKFVNGLMNIANEYKLSDGDYSNENTRSWFIMKLARIICHIEEKDSYENIHRNNLSKRLLKSQYNYDLEKEFISECKKYFGYNYTKKWEILVNEAITSIALSANFCNSVHTKPSFDFQCNIFPTHTFIGSPSKFNLHPNIQNTLDFFKTYYNSSHQNRQLQWSNSDGISTVFCYFPKGNKEINMSLIQASILLFLNTNKSITIQDILKYHNIPFNDIRDQLIPLIFSSTNILVRKNTEGEIIPNSEKFDEKSINDVVDININFVNRLKKISIPLIVRQTIKKNDIDDEISQTRLLQCEACIIRMLKSRKSLSYTDIINASVEQLSKFFPVTVQNIKKSTEKLIDKEYIKRNDDDPTILEYLA
jgi:Cullin family/Cullin protein neddylation domain